MRIDVSLYKRLLRIEGKEPRERGCKGGVGARRLICRQWSGPGIDDEVSEAFEVRRVSRRGGKQPTVRIPSNSDPAEPFRLSVYLPIPSPLIPVKYESLPGWLKKYTGWKKLGKNTKNPLSHDLWQEKLSKCDYNTRSTVTDRCFNSVLSLF